MVDDLDHADRRAAARQGELRSQMSDVNSSSQLRQAPANPGMARQPYPRPPGNGAAPAAQPRRSHSSTQYPAKYHFTTTIEAANAMNRLIRRKGFHLRE